MISKKTPSRQVSDGVFQELIIFIFYFLLTSFFWTSAVCILGHGVVIHLPTLLEEIAILDNNGIQHEGRLLISDRAHLVIPKQIGAHFSN